MNKTWNHIVVLVTVTFTFSACSTNTAPTVTSSVSSNASTVVPSVNRVAYRAPANAQQLNIESVVFSRAAGSVAAEKWRKKELRIDKNLAVSLVDYNIRGQIVSQKRAKIKQSDFDKLVATLRQANFTQLQPQRRSQAIVGGVTDLVTISSSDGIYQFKQDGAQQFPPAIQTLFTNYTNAK